MRYAVFVPIPGTALAERVINGGAVVGSVNARRSDILYPVIYLYEPAQGTCGSRNYASRVMTTVEHILEGDSFAGVTKASRGDALKVGEYDDWTGIVHVSPNHAAHAALRRWIGADVSDDVFRANLRTDDMMRKFRRVLEIADASLQAELLEALRVRDHLDWLAPRLALANRDRRGRRGSA